LKCYCSKIYEYSICMPPQYLKQVAEWFGGEGAAADGPPPSSQVVVHGLMAHPVYDISYFRLV
jgi:hypothetical protein